MRAPAPVLAPASHDDATPRRKVSLRTVAWGILAGLLVAVMASILVSHFALGLTARVVLSGSMKPDISTGSVVVIEPIEDREAAEQIQVGDVVTFLPYPDDPTSVTHRVVEITATTNGPVLTTQGDALDSVDPWETTTTQLRGVVRFDIPYLGYVAHLIGEKKQLVLTVGILGFGTYALYQLAAAVRDKARARRATPPMMDKSAAEPNGDGSETAVVAEAVTAP